MMKLKNIYFGNPVFWIVIHLRSDQRKKSGILRETGAKGGNCLCILVNDYFYIFFTPKTAGTQRKVAL